MTNPYQVVRDFEQSMAEYTGAPYAISVDSCSSALFLCCQYRALKLTHDTVVIPKRTYPSVPNALIHAGFKVEFRDLEWQNEGHYSLYPLRIIDSAKRLERNMYELFPNPLTCLSFHGKKCLKIGRGGMILTEDRHAMEWFKVARFDGRHECALPDDDLAFPGWHMVMQPEEAARGLELMQWLPDRTIDAPDKYQDLSKYEFYSNTKGQL